MSQIGYVMPVAPLEAVTLWELGPVVEADFPGFPAPTAFGLDYVFRNGFTGTDPLPCRTAFITEMKARPIDVPKHWVRTGFYAPVGNSRIEFNGFCYTPRHRRRFLRTTLVTEQAGDYAFELATCGGVRLWVQETEVARFEPFDRNTEHSRHVNLPLEAGNNEVLLHMEDLFERDTAWSARLTYLGESALSASVSAATDPERIEMVRSLAAEVRPARDFFGEEPFTLVFDEAPGFDVPVSVQVVSLQHDRTTLLDTEVTLRADEDRLVPASASEIREGYHRVRLSFGVGDVRIEREIDAAFLRHPHPERGAATEAERKREALDYAALHGDPRIGRLLALCATDREDPAAFEAILSATLEAIERREDCSDFVMVPLLWLWGHFHDRIPERHRSRVRHAILDWRYWVDEPGNDVMWFWSENHVLCFHVSQYVAGHLFPEDMFTCSGRSGAEQKRIAEERLSRWFDSVETHGFVEWNSAAYYPIDFIGLFGLLGWTKGDLKARCRALLDRLFLMIGLHTLRGVPAGSQGRAYDKELRAGPLTELAPFCRVAFGEGWHNTGVAALPLYCFSDYAAPENARAAARYDATEGLDARYTQGHDHNGKLVLHKNRSAMLSSVVEHDAGGKGHQQHVVDVRLAGHPMARLWINNPGEADPWGVKRPSFWSGNGVLPLINQHRDTVLMIYDLGATPEVDFVHAFAAVNGLDELKSEDPWLFARAGDGYASIWASVPLEPVTRGATAYREFRAAGRRSGWMVHVGSGDGSEGFEAFIARARAAAPEMSTDGSRLAVSLPSGTTLELDWNKGFSVDGISAPFEPLSTTPLITGDGSLRRTATTYQQPGA